MKVTKWQYHTIPIPVDDTFVMRPVDMDHLGQRGWELVQVVTEPNGKWIHYIFKRPAEGKYTIPKNE